MMRAYWSQDNVASVLEPDTMAEMTMLLNFSRIIWALPEWINKMPFAREANTAEAQMCQLPAYSSTGPGAPRREDIMTPEFLGRDCLEKLPRMPSGSCLILHH